MRMPSSPTAKQTARLVPVEEIMNIEGIKEKMFEKIRGSIEV